jgi:uncharacterized protein (DUF305 family)
MRRRWLAFLAGVLALALAAGLAACGGDDESSAGNETDRAFVAGVIPHHQLAIEMAEVARERGESQFVRDLADEIVAAQSEEIRLMRRIDSELAEEGVEVGDLGVPEHLTGMEEDMAALESARPFDREFIDMMVSHHAGAIRMARVEIEEGENGELVTLAQRIIAAQSREIRAMNEHRAEEFGAPSPAGGVPPEGEGEEQEAAGHSS